MMARPGRGTTRPDGARLLALRRGVLLSGVLVVSAIVIARALQLEVLEARQWRARAADQHVEVMELPAPRGIIYDRNGVPLAASRERYSLAIAPREVRDAKQLSRKLLELTDLSPRLVRAAVDKRKRWVVLPGRYDEPVRGALAGTSGVHFQAVLQRFYPHGGLASQLIGSVNLENRALGGIELEYDSLLSGKTGSATVRRDSRGRPIPGLMLRTVEPIPGHDVYVTLDHALQQIADDALRDALEKTNAAGGEVLLTDPATGEILAAASYKNRQAARNWSGVTVPYEPGSTLKPFTVAAALEEGAATLGDSLYGEQGSWTIHGRTIRDVHAMGWMTVADALRESSNIGIAKTATRLAQDAHYHHLRAFGFGSPTGVPYPSESGGRLRRPAAWSKQSQASLAIGYEISVTPLQMALAYGAIANGGMLVEPRLLREVRARDGRVVRAFETRAVRRAISERVAKQLRQVLIDVVEGGTGQQASLGTLKVAGKTGTARIAEHGRYRPGAYIATFAGFFPADDPQLVFVVKLEEPKGDYYGGLTAAPVTRATLEAALAARRDPVAGSIAARPSPEVTADLPAATKLAARVGGPREAPPTGPFIFVLGDGPPKRIAPASPERAVVPEIRGLTLRDAVRRLHLAGFRVQIEGAGSALRSVPGAGAALKNGALVRVLAGGGP
jgi:cell division protein FtsI (penicillin-binding protein 3)